MATQVRINPDGEVLITFDAGEGVVFAEPLENDGPDLDLDDPLADDDIEDVEDEDEQD